MENSSKKSEQKPKEEKSSSSLWIAVVVIVIFIILYKIPSPSTKNDESNHSNENTKQKTVASILAPEKQPLEFEIKPNLTQPISMAEYAQNYSFVFVTDQPYKIVDLDGNSYYGKAFEDVDIGLSLANRALKFATTNGTQTKMKIVFTPKIIAP